MLSPMPDCFFLAGIPNQKMGGKVKKQTRDFCSSPPDIFPYAHTGYFNRLWWFSTICLTKKRALT